MKETLIFPQSKSLSLACETNSISLNKYTYFPPLLSSPLSISYLKISPLNLNNNYGFLIINTHVITKARYVITM